MKSLAVFSTGVLLILGSYSVPMAQTGFNTTLVSQCQDMGYSFATASEGTLCLFGHGSLLDILDITDPMSPVIRARFSAPGEIHDILLESDLAYLACSTGLMIIDVSRPDAPTLVYEDQNYK